MIAIMIGVVLVIIMITVTSSAPCEERRLANQLNSNTDDKLSIMRVIGVNAKMIISTSPCTLQRVQQWNYHIHDIDNDNDKKDNM